MWNVLQCVCIEDAYFTVCACMLVLLGHVERLFVEGLNLVMTYHLKLDAL